MEKLDFDHSTPLQIQTEISGKIYAQNILYRASKEINYIGSFGQNAVMRLFLDVI